MRATGSWLTFYGAEVRRYREKAGHQQIELAKEVGYDNGHLSKIERGERVPQPQLDVNLDRIFGLDGQFEALGEQVREHSTRHRGFREYLQAEPKAERINSYDSHHAPGLLQTEAYIRALLHAERPAITEDEIESRLALRLTRQDVLRRDPPCPLWCVIDESVLYRAVGSGKTMTEQLDHLIEWAGRPLVTVQVYPFSAGADPAYGQSFVVAELTGGQGACHIDAPDGSGPQPGALDRYRVVFDHLRASALPEGDSLGVIAARVEELSRT